MEITEQRPMELRAYHNMIRLNMKPRIQLDPMDIRQLMARAEAQTARANFTKEQIILEIR
jgi:hypothetical protein